MNYHGEPYLSSRTGFIGRIRSDRTGFTGRRCVAGAVSQARCLPGKRRVHRLPGGAAAAAGTHTHTHRRRRQPPRGRQHSGSRRSSSKRPADSLARGLGSWFIGKDRPTRSRERARARVTGRRCVRGCTSWRWRSSAPSRPPRPAPAAPARCPPPSSPRACSRARSRCRDGRKGDGRKGDGRKGDGRKGHSIQVTGPSEAHTHTPSRQVCVAASRWHTGVLPDASNGSCP